MKNAEFYKKEKAQRRISSMKKSLVAVMLGLMMTVSLVGCGGCGTEVAEEVATEVVEEPTEVVEEVVEEPATEVATEVVEEPATEVVEPAVEEVSPYSYTELNQVMYAQSTVNVRDLPEQTGGKLGSLSTNQEVTVTGQCNETGWYRISYSGGEGFVSNSYLGTEKVAVKSSSSGSQSSQPEAPAPSAPEAPAEESSDPYAGMTWEEASDATDITPDSYHCWYCEEMFSTVDEMKAHTLEVHGVELPYN